MPLPGEAATPGSASPGSASRCIRLAVFCFRRPPTFRRPASRLLSTLFRHIRVMPYHRLRYGFPGTAPKGPPAWFCPFPMVQKRAWPSPDTPGMHSAESGMDAPTGGVPVQEETEIQPHILQLHPDTIFRQTPVHDFVLSPDTVHRDALLLSHRSGGFPVLLRYETPADRPGLQAIRLPPPEVYQQW